MDRIAIIQRVKIKMDEFTPVNEDVTHPLDSYIQPTLDQAALELLKDAPLIKLAPENVELYVKDEEGTETGSILTYTDKVYRIDFPVAVLRPTSIKFPDWSRAIYTFKDPASPEAQMQGSRATRGGLEKPVVVSDRGTISNAGRMVAYCYTHPKLKKNDEAETFVREPQIKVITKKKAEELDEMLVEPLVLLTASKVLSSVQDHEAAKILYEQYANNIMS